MRPAANDARRIVLMARIVDSAGKALRPSEVTVVEYSVYLFGHDRPRDSKAVARHAKSRIDVTDVFLDTLRRNAPWTWDAIGYNFRHAIDLETMPPFCPRHGFQLRYEITTTLGQTSILRFDVRRQHHDRN